MLLALLPCLLLTDRRLTRNDRNLFMERCHQVVALRDLGPLVDRPESRHRRRLTSAMDDERVLTDVLKLIHMGQDGRAGKALMRDEVARGTESLMTAVGDLFPDGHAELERFNAEHAGEAMPDPTPLDREVFMATIGATEGGRVRQGAAADAAQWR